MPVWVSTDPTLDLNKAGDRRRHIDADCPVYLAQVPVSERSAAKGRPNTVKLQETTVRCEHPDCWAKWEQDQKDKKSKKSGSTATNSKGAATTPAQKVGGKAADLAAKAKQARQKPVAAGATA